MKISKFYSLNYILILLYLIMLSCSNTLQNTSEYIFIGEGSEKRNAICYLIDGKFKSFDPMSDTCYKYNSTQNTVYNSFYNRKYYPIQCSENNIKYDTIYMANSMYGLSHNLGIIFNAKIIGKFWQVGVYYPYDFKGTYKFDVTNAEMNLFNCSLNKFLSKSPLFQNADTNINYYYKSESVLSIDILSGKERTSDVRQILENTYTTYLLNDLTMIIIKNHLQTNNKINDIVLFSEFRKMIIDDAIKNEFEKH